MGYTFDFAVIFENFDRLLLGCISTLVLSITAMAIALLVAIAFVFAQMASPKLLGYPIRTFVEVVRNTPFLVQIFFIYFGLPQIGVRFDPNTAAIIALAINGTAFATEIIRSGVEGIPRGLIEAGRALGMRPLQIYRYIVQRPALQMVYPALVSEFIMLMLTSSIVSSISAQELTQAAAVLESKTFRSFEVFLVVTGLYGAMSLLLSAGFRLIYRLRISYPTA